MLARCKAPSAAMSRPVPCRSIKPPEAQEHRGQSCRNLHFRPNSRGKRGRTYLVRPCRIGARRSRLSWQHWHGSRVAKQMARRDPGRADACRAFTEMRFERFGASRVLFFNKETALLHANFAMDSIPHSLQAFLMIAGGIIGLLAAFSLVDSSNADAPASHEVRSSEENRVQSGERVPVERPGRRY